MEQVKRYDWSPSSMEEDDTGLYMRYQDHARCVMDVCRMAAIVERRAIGMLCHTLKLPKDCDCEDCVELQDARNVLAMWRGNGARDGYGPL